MFKIVLVFFFCLASVYSHTFVERSASRPRSLNGLHKIPNTSENTVLLASNDLTQVKKPDISKEILSGLVVAVATVPTSISYANVVGLNPLLGIWTSAIVGFCTTLVGGAPGLVAGAAGVIALPMAKLVKAHGVFYMTLGLILSGLLEVVFGISRLCKHVDLVTDPVVAGFLDAFSVFLIKNQLKLLKDSSGAWLPTEKLYSNAAIALLCTTLIKVSPLFIKKFNLSIPPSLIGIVISTLVATVLKLPIKTLEDHVGKEYFTGGLSSLPKFKIPDLSTITVSPNYILTIIGSAAISTMLIGIIETVLAQKIYSQTYRYNSDRKLSTENYDRATIGLGLGNIVCALFGGFGGCGLVPNTLLNGASGGLDYVSSYSYSIFLALFVIVFSPILSMIPMASLSGLMLTVAWNTFEWKETKEVFTHWNKSRQDIMNLIALLISGYWCYEYDMGQGILIGVFIAKLLPLITFFQGLISDQKSINVRQ